MPRLGICRLPLALFSPSICEQQRCISGGTLLPQVMLHLSGLHPSNPTVLTGGPLTLSAWRHPQKEKGEKFGQVKPANLRAFVRMTGRWFLGLISLAKVLGISNNLAKKKISELPSFNHLKFSNFLS